MNNSNNGGQLSSSAGYVQTTTTRQMTDVEILSAEAKKEAEQKKRDAVKKHVAMLLKDKQEELENLKEAEEDYKEACEALEKFEALNMEEAYKKIADIGSGSSWSLMYAQSWPSGYVLTR